MSRSSRLVEEHHHQQPGQLRLLPDGLEHRQAVHLRHVEIKQHHIRQLLTAYLPQQPHGFLTAARHDHFRRAPGLLEGDQRQFQIVGIVVYQ